MDFKKQELMYKGVLVYIKPGFGWEYSFIYFGHPYAGYYNNLENCKQGAKNEIDRITSGKKSIEDGLSV